MKLLPLSLICLLVPVAARAAGSAITFTQSWSGSLVVPDHDAVGASSSITVVAPGYDRIVSVMLQLEIDGGWKLFPANQGPGDTSTLKSWSLAVIVGPEPSAALMMGVAVMPGVVGRGRRSSGMRRFTGRDAP